MAAIYLRALQSAWDAYRTGGDAGLIVPPDDVTGLVAAIDRLLSDDNLRARIAVHSRARVLERYGIDRLLGDIDDVYRELLSGK